MAANGGVAEPAGVERAGLRGAEARGAHGIGPDLGQLDHFVWIAGVRPRMQAVTARAFALEDRVPRDRFASSSVLRSQHGAAIERT